MGRNEERNEKMYMWWGTLVLCSVKMNNEMQSFIFNFSYIKIKYSYGNGHEMQNRDSELSLANGL